MLDVVDGHSHRHPSRAAWLAVVAGSGRTGSSSKLGPRWEVAGRWAGRAAGKSKKNSYRKVRHKVQTGAYGFELDSSRPNSKTIGSSPDFMPNPAISQISSRARRYPGANILQDLEGLSLAISSLLTQCFQHCQFLLAHRLSHFEKVLGEPRFTTWATLAAHLCLVVAGVRAAGISVARQPPARTISANSCQLGILPTADPDHVCSSQV